MNITVAHVFGLEDRRITLFATLLDRVAEIRNATRCRRQNAEAISYLRTLDRHLLGDMGIDFNELSKINPGLAKRVSDFANSPTDKSGSLT